MTTTHITEMIPETLPEWARDAMDDGQFFNVVDIKWKELEENYKHWTPTLNSIDSLPKPIKRYIHNLIIENTLLKERQNLKR